MCQQAEQRSASAIIAMHYDATEVMTGLTEALCCGTAVTVVRETSEVQVILGVETGCKLQWRSGIYSHHGPRNLIKLLTGVLNLLELL